MAFFLVACGGGLGACTRYGLSLIFRNQAFHLPVGTVVANLLGCLVIGLIAGADLRMPGLSPQARLFLATGFCGGLTTLSSFIYETTKISNTGDYAMSALYVALTLAGSSLCFALGVFITKSLTRTI